MITVDLDRESTVHLLRAFFNVLHVYNMVHGEHLDSKLEPLSISDVQVTFSPSGVGYHIKIPRTVDVLEDLRIRALLWDDPYRLCYALKKWTLNPKEEYVDLCFDEKVNRKEEYLDLLGIIIKLESEEFVRTLLYLIEKERIEEAEKMIQQVSEKLNPHLKELRGKIYIGCIAFKKDNLLEELEEICKDIGVKDLSFKWRSYPCFFPEFDWMLCVFTHDKDLAWKRITWLKNRTKLKDTETRLWVKERIST